MSQIFLYAHGGSGNHGCEAIVRSTISMLRGEDIVLISSRPQEDIKYGLSDICRILKDRNDSIRKTDLDFWKAYFSLKIRKDYVPMEMLWYKDSFEYIKKDDIAISIGGDNYCYADRYKYVMLHDMLKKRKAKTVLWGCSVDPHVIENKVIADDLARYDLITARDSITYDALSRINTNTILVSDPAFQLDIKKTKIPEHFLVNNTVGINLSPMAIENEVVSGITLENYSFLIEYILSKTNMNIALIPHVVWKESDDRIPLKKLFEKYKKTNRLCLIEDQGCEYLKYLISKCRFFIGTRTHATIAAYSTFIPTLVLGYSIKSIGIAKDLFGAEKAYVIQVQDLKNSSDLCMQFVRIIEDEIYIKKRLKEVMPRYVNRGIGSIHLGM